MDDNDGFKQFADAVKGAAAAADAYVKAVARYIAVRDQDELERRLNTEYKLGYTLPNWVWNVMEQQRKQFGSGNGREINE